VNAGAIRAGRAFVELNADNTKFTRALRNAENQLNQFGSKLREIGQGMMSVGLVAAAPMALSTKMFASFDDQMRATKAVTNATAAEFEAMTEKAKYLGRTTSYTASQVAGAMTELGRMGFSPGEINASIQSILDLARGTGTDLAEAALIASGTLRSFSLDASRMTDVVDVLMATANNSAQTLTDLGESMKYAAPVAAEFGMSLRDTAKALGTMAQFTIKGSMAGTSLRNILLRMANKSTQKILTGIGVSVSDVAGNMRPLADILNDVGVALGKVPQVERLGLLDQIFGMRAVTGGSKLTTESFKRLNDAIDNFQGTARRTAAEMDAGIGGAFRILLSAVEGVALAVGDKLAPPITAIAKKLTDVNDVVAKWIDKNQTLVRVIGLTVGGLVVAGAALMAFGIGITFIGKALTAVMFPFLAMLGIFKLLTGAALLLANPFVAAGVALASFAGAIAYATGLTDKAVSFITKKLDGLKAKYGEAVKAFKAALLDGDIEKAAKIFWLTLKLAWISGINGLIGEWHELWRTIQEKASDMWTGVVSGWHMAVKGIKTGIANLKMSLQSLWAKAKKGFRDMYADWTYWLGWYYADLRGMLDKDFDVNAMKWAMYEETEGSKADAQKEYLDDLKSAQDEFNTRSQAINQEFTDALGRTLEDGNRRQEEINNKYLRRMEALRQDIDEAKRRLEEEITPQVRSTQNQEAQDRIAAARKRVAEAALELKQARDRRGMDAALSETTDPKKREEMMKAQRARELDAQLAYRTAQKELQDAVTAKQSLRKQPRGVRPDIERKAPTTFADFLAGRLGMQAVGLSYEKASAIGSFSGFSRFGMQGESSAAERTANAVEEIAKNTKDLLDETRESNEGAV
jgi:TP901 family phage tail tape measure protein